jgi:hypothetical protein
VSAVRRLYVYGVAFASLLMLAIGVSGLGGVLLETLLPATGAAGQAVVDGLRSSVTQNAALVLVGLPVWLLHWGMARRAARSDLEERRTALRRLFLYAVLAVMAVRWAFSAHSLLSQAVRQVLRDPDASGLRALLEPVPWLLVASAVWAYHRHVAAGPGPRCAGGTSTV